jgi:hypothetical protein
MLSLRNSLRALESSFFSGLSLTERQLLDPLLPEDLTLEGEIMAVLHAIKPAVLIHFQTNDHANNSPTIHVTLEQKYFKTVIEPFLKDYENIAKKNGSSEHVVLSAAFLKPGLFSQSTETFDGALLVYNQSHAMIKPEGQTTPTLGSILLQDLNSHPTDTQRESQFVDDRLLAGWLGYPTQLPLSEEEMQDKGGFVIVSYFDKSPRTETARSEKRGDLTLITSYGGTHSREDSAAISRHFHLYRNTFTAESLYDLVINIE